MADMDDPKPRYRIKPDVRPFPGEVLVADRQEGNWVWGRVGRRPYQRQYALHELIDIQGERKR